MSLCGKKFFRTFVSGSRLLCGESMEWLEVWVEDDEGLETEIMSILWMVWLCWVSMRYGCCLRFKRTGILQSTISSMSFCSTFLWGLFCLFSSMIFTFIILRCVNNYFPWSFHSVSCVPYLLSNHVTVLVIVLLFFRFSHFFFVFI